MIVHRFSPKFQEHSRYSGWPHVAMFLKPPSEFMAKAVYEPAIVFFAGLLLCLGQSRLGALCSWGPFLWPLACSFKVPCRKCRCGRCVIVPMRCVHVRHAFGIVGSNSIARATEMKNGGRTTKKFARPCRFAPGRANQGHTAGDFCDGDGQGDSAGCGGAFAGTLQPKQCVCPLQFRQRSVDVVEPIQAPKQSYEAKVQTASKGVQPKEPRQQDKGMETGG